MNQQVKNIIILMLKAGCDGGNLGYKWMKLLKFNESSKSFELITDVGFQRVHYSEILPVFHQYKRVQ